jgi:hypothetical protein
MFESLFGSEMPLAARFFIAFLVVLALIGVTAWLVRRFGANRLGSTARGRQPRLAVIDAATVDGRRRLVLIRRDNIEHLLMIGGPTDLVVEPNIVRAVAAREVAREPGADWSARRTCGAPFPGRRKRLALAASRRASPDAPASVLPAGGNRRAVDSAGANRTSAAGRYHRDCQRIVEPPQQSGYTAGCSQRTTSAFARTAERTCVNASRSQSCGDGATARGRAPSFARARKADHRLPIPSQDICPALLSKEATQVHARPLRDHKPRVEPKFEPKAEPKFEPRSEPKFDSKPEPREPAATPGKNLYENLEEEMASLLGRPPGKS